MKYISVLIVFGLMGAKTYADCSQLQASEQVQETKVIATDVPKHLVGATITVTLADGSSSTVPAEQYKVVPRRRQEIVTKIRQSNVLVCTGGQKTEQKNRISAGLGRGPLAGLDVKQNSNQASISNQVGQVGVLQYQRLIWQDISVGAQMQSNSTALVNVGLDF